MHIIPVISYGHWVPTPGQPVVRLTPYLQGSDGAAVRIPISKSLTFEPQVIPVLKADALTTRPSTGLNRERTRWRVILLFINIVTVVCSMQACKR